MRYFIGSLTVVVVALGLWGVGGCGGSADSGISPDVTISSGDFEGQYKLRDHLCTYNPVNEFYISDFGGDQFSLTIIAPGESGTFEGDMFYGTLSDQTLYFNDLGCGAARITSDEAAQTCSDQTRVTTLRGDITAFCPDVASSDGYCFMSFKPE